jgi:hypothetical protein
MNTSDVNIPTPRLPGQATQPAATPSFSPVQLTGTYPVPEYLTARGLRTFRSEVSKFAVAMGAELEKRADAIVSRGDRPEHTAEAVIKARRDCLKRMGSGYVGSRVRRARSVLAVILLTVSIVGLSVMQRFLHSYWQAAVFGAFVLLAILGLGLMWPGRPGRHESRRPDGHESAEHIGLSTS